MGKHFERHFGFQNVTRPMISNNNCLLFLLQVPNESELKKTTYFVPIAEPEQPFVIWEVKSSGPSKGKYIAVDEDGRLSVKTFDFTQCRQGTTFVKIKV